MREVADSVFLGSLPLALAHILVLGIGGAVFSGKAGAGLKLMWAGLGILIGESLAQPLVWWIVYATTPQSGHDEVGMKMVVGNGFHLIVWAVGIIMLIAAVAAGRRPTGSTWGTQQAPARQSQQPQQGASGQQWVPPAQPWQQAPARPQQPPQGWTPGQ